MKSIEEAIEFIESLPKEDFYKLRDWILGRDEIEKLKKAVKAENLILTLSPFLCKFLFHLNYTKSHIFDEV